MRVIFILFIFISLFILVCADQYEYVTTKHIEWRCSDNVDFLLIVDENRYHVTFFNETSVVIKKQGLWLNGRCLLIKIDESEQVYTGHGLFLREIHTITTA